MTYDSLDTIPLKLFLKISKTGDISLLTNDKDQLSKVKEIWERLVEDFELLDPDKTIDKTLKLLIKIERYTAQMNALQFAVQALRFDRDVDLENAIREQGFKLKEESYHEDLDRVERESAALQMMIDMENEKLPKVDVEDAKATSLDKVILGYCAITGLQYTNTNVITVTQFYSLKELFENKLKALEKQRQEAISLKNKKR